jgi:chromosome segregation ATPase
MTTTIKDLQNLQAKIDADTDPTTAKTDRKSIVNDYKIYAIYEPRVRLLVIIDNLQTSANTVSSLSARLQTLLNTLQSQGKNVTPAQNSLNDINAQLTKINSSLTADKSLVSNVTIATQNPQSVFVTVRQNLANLRFDFAQIRLDIAQMRQQLHQFETVPSISPSPTK